MKLIKSITLIIMLTITCLTYAGNKYYVDKDKGFLFTLDETDLFGDAAVIVGYDWTSNKSFDSLTGHMNFPDYVTSTEVGKHRVRLIRDNAFCESENLRSISFPNSYMEVILSYGFYCCENLTTVNNLNVRHLANLVFSCCKNLSKITLCDGLISIGYFCFDKCYNLKSIIIPETVQSIGFGAFSQCTRLEYVDIRGQISELERITFAGCSKLDTIILPSKLNKIGEECFSDCKNLKSISIPENVKEIGEAAFKGCNKLERIYIDRSPGSYSPPIEVSENTFSQETYDNALLILDYSAKYIDYLIMMFGKSSNIYLINPEKEKRNQLLEKSPFRVQT